MKGYMDKNPRAERTTFSLSGTWVCLIAIAAWNSLESFSTLAKGNFAILFLWAVLLDVIVNLVLFMGVVRTDFTREMRYVTILIGWNVLDVGFSFIGGEAGTFAALIAIRIVIDVVLNVGITIMAIRYPQDQSCLSWAERTDGRHSRTNAEMADFFEIDPEKKKRKGGMFTHNGGATELSKVSADELRIATVDPKVRLQQSIERNTAGARPDPDIGRPTPEQVTNAMEYAVKSGSPYPQEALPANKWMYEMPAMQLANDWTKRAAEVQQVRQPVQSKQDTHVNTPAQRFEKTFGGQNGEPEVTLAVNVNNGAQVHEVPIADEVKYEQMIHPSIPTPTQQFTFATKTASERRMETNQAIQGWASKELPVNLGTQLPKPEFGENPYASVLSDDDYRYYQGVILFDNAFTSWDRMTGRPATRNEEARKAWAASQNDPRLHFAWEELTKLMLAKQQSEAANIPLTAHEHIRQTISDFEDRIAGVARRPETEPLPANVKAFPPTQETQKEDVEESKPVEKTSIIRQIEDIMSDMGYSSMVDFDINTPFGVNPSPSDLTNRMFVSFKLIEREKAILEQSLRSTVSLSEIQEVLATFRQDLANIRVHNYGGIIEAIIASRTSTDEQGKKSREIVQDRLDKATKAVAFYKGNYPALDTGVVENQTLAELDAITG